VQTGHSQLGAGSNPVLSVEDRLIMVDLNAEEQLKVCFHKKSLTQKRMPPSALSSGKFPNLKIPVHHMRRYFLSTRKKSHVGPGMVAHTCNPSYSGGRDEGDHSSRPAQSKKLVKSC
jgi:hypothetical protein